MTDGDRSAAVDPHEHLIGPPPPPPDLRRETYVDLLRAGSLLIVVLWHWVFTIFQVTDDGLKVTSPLAFYDTFWILTWFFQVMPLFFFVGGFAHTIVWAKVQRAGGGYVTFVKGRLQRLLLPILTLALIAVAFGALAALITGSAWMFGTAILIMTPVWFLGLYALLVLIAPPAIAAHRRWGAVCVVVLAAWAGLNDMLRFAQGVEWIGALNLIVVWAFCHQFGFNYGRLRDGTREMAWMLFLGGLGALVVLTSTGIYPPSMVGVPGDPISNMSPPTLGIVALCTLQAGAVILIRPWMVRRLDTRRRWQLFSEYANKFSMPVFLLHTTGLAITLALLVLVFGYFPPPEPNLEWWLTRPLYVILPALFTAPLIYLFGGRMTKKQRTEPELPAGDKASDPERNW